MGIYYLYGSNVQSVISCVVDGPLGISIKVALIVQLMFAFPLNAAPVWVTVEPWLDQKLARFGPRGSFWLTCLWRGLYILLTAILAFSIPYFGDFSNLVGAIATSFITWILPPILHLKAMGRGIPLKFYLLNVACMTFGFAVMFSSSAVTVIHLIGQITNTKPLNPATC